MLSFHEEERDTVVVADFTRILESEATARKVIRNLLRKGWLLRLKAGRFLIMPSEYGPTPSGEFNPLAVASAVVEPSYVGWWAAAAHHGLTTQRPLAVAVATKKPQPTRTIEDTDIHFIHVVDRKFFGFESYEILGRKAIISTPAKSVVDCIDRPDLAGGPSEVARIVFGASDDVAAVEILEAAERMDSIAVLQRLGFFVDLVSWKWPSGLRDRLRAAIPASYRSILGRAQKEEGDLGYVSDWGIFVHARKSDLLADVASLQPVVVS